MPTKRKTFNRRRFALAIAALLISYIGSYICLAFHGQWYWSQTGQRRYAFGLAASDVERWFPAWHTGSPFAIYVETTRRAATSQDISIPH